MLHETCNISENHISQIVNHLKFIVNNKFTLLLRSLPISPTIIVNRWRERGLPTLINIVLLDIL
jgi:hypothetical protein